MLQAYAEPHSAVPLSSAERVREPPTAMQDHPLCPPSGGWGEPPAGSPATGPWRPSPCSGASGRRSPSDGREHQLPDPGTPGNTGQAFFYSVQLSETLPSVCKYNDVMPEIYFKILKVNIFKGNKDRKKQGKGTDTTSLAKLVTADTRHVDSLRFCERFSGK